MKKILAIIVAVIIIVIVIIFSFNSDPEQNRQTVSTPSFPNSDSLPGTNTNNAQDTNLDQDNNINTTRNQQAAVRPDLRKLSRNPVVNLTSFGEGSEALVTRWLERGTGHIYDYSYKTDEITRITNTTIPKVQEVYWANLGQSLIFRYIDEAGGVVKSFSARLPSGKNRELDGNKDLGENGGPISLEGFFLPDNISVVSVAPRGNEKQTCNTYLSANISPDKINSEAEVRLLQNFLKDFEGADITVTGEYSEATQKAVDKFQLTYRSRVLDPVGLSTPSSIVGPSTRAEINRLYCQRTGGDVVGSRAIYLIPNNEGSNLYVSNFDSGGNLVYSSKVRDWISSWASSNTITLSVRPSSESLGHIYSLNLGSSIKSDRGLSKLLGNKVGLTALMSKNAKHLLYTELNGKILETHLLNISSSESSRFFLDTLPSEKCVWSDLNESVVYCAAHVGVISGDEPDDWYKGVSHTNDDIYKIDVEIGSVQLLASPSVDAREALDITNISLSQDESVLVFRDRISSHAWSLTLPN